jgi:hypothetical protein
MIVQDVNVAMLSLTSFTRERKTGGCRSCMKYLRSFDCMNGEITVLLDEIYCLTRL